MERNLIDEFGCEKQCEYKGRHIRIQDGIHKQYEGEVRYPYADVGGSELLHIGKVNQDNRRDYKYICPCCKKTLRPRLSRGSKRSHFAHNPGECCDQDRYMHSTAERLLKEKWDRDEPFEITMKVRTVCSRFSTCIFGKASKRQCTSEEMKTYDLKKHYTQCLVEKKYGEFIPDLCLIDETGKHDPIFIEIWSKHKNSEKKADSEYMIIEIRLKTVDDLEDLPKHPITESDDITFSHFKDCSMEPEIKGETNLMKYTLYSGSLKSYVDTKTVNCSNYNTRHHPKAVLEIVGMKSDSSVSSFWKFGNSMAIDRGYDIRSCYLCQQFGEDKSTIEFDSETGRMTDPERGCRREFAKRGLIPCNPDDASICEHFTIKDRSIKGSLKAHSETTLYIWERHPDGTETEEYQEGKNDTEESAFRTTYYSPNYIV